MNETPQPAVGELPNIRFYTLNITVYINTSVQVLFWEVMKPLKVFLI